MIFLGYYLGCQVTYEFCLIFSLVAFLRLLDTISSLHSAEDSIYVQTSPFLSPSKKDAIIVLVKRNKLFLTSSSTSERKSSSTRPKPVLFRDHVGDKGRARSREIRRACSPQYRWSCWHSLRLSLPLLCCKRSSSIVPLFFILLKYTLFLSILYYHPWDHRV